MRPIRSAMAALVAVLVALGGLGACGSGDPSPPVARIRVVAGNFALAQLVEAVGSGRVDVVDLSAGAPDDRRVTPSSAERQQMQAAALVVVVGDGYQPGVEEAAGTGPRVLSVLAALGTQPSPQFWLDPAAMKRATTLVAGALGASDPSGKVAYHDGANNFTAVLGTLNIDFQSSLADCQHKVVIVPDHAFAAVTRQNLLQLETLGPTAGAAPVARAVASVRAHSLTTVYSEPPVTSSAIASVAAQTGTKVLALDTLDGPPPAGEPAHYPYFDRMEDDLARFSAGLQCPDTSTGP